MCVGAGPRFMLYLYSNLVSRVFVIPNFGCFRFCVKAKVAFFHMKRLRITHQLQLIFQ